MDYKPVDSLYIIALVELIVGLFLGNFTLSVLLLIIILFALLTRFYRNYLLSEQKHGWTGIKAILSYILVKNELLPETTVVQVETIPESVRRRIDDVSAVAQRPDPEVIEKMRKVGIDGILVLMLLLKEENALVSVNVIQKALSIPLSTVYRTVKRLEENTGVKAHYILETPGKAYYRITEAGESLVCYLYEFLNQNQFPLLSEGSEGVLV